MCYESQKARGKDAQLTVKKLHWGWRDGSEGKVLVKQDWQPGLISRIHIEVEEKNQVFKLSPDVPTPYTHREHNKD